MSMKKRSDEKWLRIALFGDEKVSSEDEDDDDDDKVAWKWAKKDTPVKMHSSMLPSSSFSPIEEFLSSLSADWWH